MSNNRIRSWFATLSRSILEGDAGGKIHAKISPIRRLPASGRHLVCSPAFCGIIIRSIERRNIFLDNKGRDAERFVEIFHYSYLSSRETFVPRSQRSLFLSSE